MFQEMLKRAKDRVAGLTADVAATTEQLQYAEKRGMKLLAGNLTEQLRRQKKLLSNAEGVVMEIEKENPSLPLKGGK